MAESKKKDLTEFEAELDAKAEKLDKLIAAYEDKLASLDEPKRSEGALALKDISREKDDDYVELKLFKDGERYKDDVLVGVNGELCQIQRGAPVKVKRKFASVIAQSEIATAVVNDKMVAADGNMVKIG